MLSIEEIIKPYLTNNQYDVNEFYSDSRYKLEYECVLFRESYAKFAEACQKFKWEGKFKDIRNIGDTRLFTIKVLDTTIKSRDKKVREYTLVWGDVPQKVNQDLLLEFLTDASASMKVNRQTNASVATKEELALKGKATETINVDLTLPSELGKYSKADVAFHKWFCKDDSGNRYLRLKDGSLVLIPMLDSASPKVKDEPSFWSKFFKSYREDINKMLVKARSILWEIYKHECAAASSENLREAPIITEEGDFSARQKIHEVVPKLIMNRLGVRYTLIKTEDASFLKDISPMVRETPSASFKITSEENLQNALATIIPLVDDSELDVCVRYADDTNGTALHRIQTEQFKHDLPEELSKVGKLPGFWLTYFENRLAHQKKSGLYRIAKWITGCLDADNYSRKVLVIVGHGNESKSLFSSVIEQGFNRLSGSRMCSILPGEAVTLQGNTQNGLANCLDSRVIITPDITQVTDFLKSDVVKAITGCDTVTCNVKYRDPIQKNMAGTKIMVTTNYRTYISDAFVETRISPVYFTRSDRDKSDWDPVEVKRKLLETFPDFIAWCYRYTYAIECEMNLAHKGDQPIWSDGVDNNDTQAVWSCIGIDDEHDEGMFAWHSADENQEILTDDIACICDKYLIKVGLDNKTTCSDIRAMFRSKLGYNELKSRSRQWKLIVTKIKEWNHEAEVITSNGIQYFRGVQIDGSSIKSSSRQSAQEWANSPDVKTKEQELLELYIPGVSKELPC